MPLWLIVILIALATHRVTRIITRDAIPLVATPREAFVQRWGTFADAATPEQKKTSLNGKRTNGFMRSLAYLWECDWCASVWVSALITSLAWRWTSLGDEHWLIAVFVGLTASSITGLIAQREPD
jgi:hypothetical protein